MSNYDRELPLLCPVCGNDQFKSTDDRYQEPDEAPDEIKLRCADCGAVFSKEELIHENSERIDIVLNEMVNAFFDDIESNIYRGL